MEPSSPAAGGSGTRSVPLSGLALTALLLGIAYGPTLYWAAGRWWTDPFYSHGPLVPLVTAALLWGRRKRLVPDPAPSWAAFSLLAVAGLIHLVGIRLMFEFLCALSFIGMMAGLALLAGGRPMLRAAAFPLGYLVFAVPLPMAVLEKVSLPLQLMSSAGAAATLRATGVEVSRQGVLLVFPDFTLAVADACSGLRSLITVLALSVLAASLTPASAARRTLLVALASAAAVGANILRIAVAGYVGLAFDGEAGCAFFEKYSSWLFFALVILASIGLAALLAEAPRPGRAEDEPPPPRPVAWKPLLPAVLLAAGTAAGALALRAGRPPATPDMLAHWSPAIEGWTVEEMRSPPSQPGEEIRAGTLAGPGGLRAGFTVLHSVAGRHLHSPEACSLSNGWIAERMEVRELPAAGGTRLPVHLWVMRRGNRRVALAFWYDLDGRPARGTLSHHARALWGRLIRGRLDSVYAEIAMPLPLDGSAPPDAALLHLATALHAQVREARRP